MGEIVVQLRRVSPSASGAPFFLGAPTGTYASSHLLVFAMGAHQLTKWCTPRIEARREQEGREFLRRALERAEGKRGEGSAAQFTKRYHLRHEPKWAVIGVNKCGRFGHVAMVSWIFNDKLCSDAPTLEEKGGRASDNGVGPGQFTLILGWAIESTTRAVM